MSEYIEFDDEGEPFFDFHSNLGELVAYRDNSIIYQHQFQDRGADHLFIEIEEQGEEVRGAFLFRAESEESKPGVFDKILAELHEYDWPTMICDTVSECDQAVFDHFVDKHIIKVTNKKLEAWLNG